jgi:hypothetical protein
MQLSIFSFISIDTKECLGVYSLHVPITVFIDTK